MARLMFNCEVRRLSKHNGKTLLRELHVFFNISIAAKFDRMSLLIIAFHYSLTGGYRNGEKRGNKIYFKTDTILQQLDSFRGIHALSENVARAIANTMARFDH